MQPNQEQEGKALLVFEIRIRQEVNKSRKHYDDRKKMRNMRGNIRAPCPQPKNMQQRMQGTISETEKKGTIP